MLGLSLSPQFESKSPSLGRNDGLNVAVIPFVVASIGSRLWVGPRLFCSPSSWSGWCWEWKRASQADVVGLTWFHPPFLARCGNNFRPLATCAVLERM